MDGTFVKRLGLLIALAFGTGCAQEIVVRDLATEREANEIIEILAFDGINAQKAVVDDGRKKTYSIMVSGSRRLDAYAILNQHDLPRITAKGYGAFGSEGGLIPSASEEKAKFLSAVEGELENQVRLISGILDAQVQIVIPEDSPLRDPTEAPPVAKASVAIIYLPGANNSRPLSEPEVKSLIANGVEKLTSENVVVAMRPKVISPLFKRVLDEVRATAGESSECSGLQCLPAKQLNLLAAALLAIVVLLGGIVAFSQARLRSVRGRLIRLQTEIAKARRRPGEGSASGAA